MIRIGPLLFAIVASALFGAAACAQGAQPENEESRFSFFRAEDGYLRLDGHTGQVSLCTRRPVGWLCQALPEERAAFEAEVTRLQLENAALKQGAGRTTTRCSAGLEGPRRPPGATGDGSPIDREAGQFMSVIENVWHRLVAIVRERRSRICSASGDLRHGDDAAGSHELSELTSVTAASVITATLVVRTSGPGFTEITQDAARFIAAAGARDGALLLYLRHTSASLVIQENADPDVCADLATALEAPGAGRSTTSWLP